MPSKQTDVVVTGDDQDGVQLVTGVINKALLDNGFTNVGVMSPTTGEPTLVPDVPSLGDLVRATKPHFFHQPVTVTGLVPPHITDVPAYIERNIDQLDKYPKSAMARYVMSSLGLQSDDVVDEPKKGKEVKVHISKTKKAEPLDRDALVANVHAAESAAENGVGIPGDTRDLEAAAAAASALNGKMKESENDVPTAAELTEAAKTMSKAAHQNDHHHIDTKKAASKIAQKALDAA